MSSRVALAALVLAVLPLHGCASQPPPKSQASPLLGSVMPAFESKSLSGNQVISGAYEGHKVVVSFVASSCEPCEKTLAAADSLYSDQRELVVVGVFRRDGADAALPLASRLALHFPVVVDRDGSLARMFQIHDVPSTFVIDRAGRVSWVGGSNVDEDVLGRAIASAD